LIDSVIKRKIMLQVLHITVSKIAYSSTGKCSNNSVTTLLLLKHYVSLWVPMGK